MRESISVYPLIAALMGYAHAHFDSIYIASAEKHKGDKYYYDMNLVVIGQMSSYCV